VAELPVAELPVAELPVPEVPSMGGGLLSAGRAGSSRRAGKVLAPFHHLGPAAAGPSRLRFSPLAPAAARLPPAGGRADARVNVMTARLVVLVSGTGTTLQALLDASTEAAYGAQVVAVGSDRLGITGLRRADQAGVPTFTLRVADYPSRADWDEALTGSCASFQPDLIVSAGFMKLAGPAFLERFGGRFINSHPALLPSFPGMHGVRDALEYGVKVTGCTIFMVDAGIDTGPVIAQAAVPVQPGDDEESLHERIKLTERTLLADTVGRMAREGWTVQGRKLRFGR
jgi:phosphoribosylglycinamide formyltransferase-1